MNPNIILDYWFPNDEFQKFWFSGKIDKEITDKFNDYINAFLDNKLEKWKTESFNSKLALIILLDQFTRSIFRNKKRNKIFDEEALKLSNDIIFTIKNIKLNKLVFVLMPFRHSSNKKDRQFVIDFNNVYEKNNIIENKILWKKFKSASLRNL